MYCEVKHHATYVTPCHHDSGWTIHCNPEVELIGIYSPVHLNKSIYTVSHSREKTTRSNIVGQHAFSPAVPLNTGRGKQTIANRPLNENKSALRSMQEDWQVSAFFNLFDALFASPTTLLWPSRWSGLDYEHFHHSDQSTQRNTVLHN